MKNLLQLIDNSKILEICTINQSYHNPALIERKNAAANYKIIEINKLNKNPKYKFNSRFSVYRQNISLSNLNYIKEFISDSDIVILHSWKGKLWNDLINHAKYMNKKIIFMNDMVIQYNFLTINWLIRKIFDLRIRLQNKNNLYFVSLNNLHEQTLKNRFGKINIIYHQWHYCYLKSAITEFNKRKSYKGIPEYSIDQIRVLFIGRNISRKGINRFIKIAKIMNFLNKDLVFSLVYSGKQIKSKIPNNVKLIKIDSIRDNSNFYLNNDILYCPFKNEPLGLVPLEGLSFGCLLLFDQNIPSMYDFKKNAFKISNSLNDELKLWLRLINDIKEAKFNRQKNTSLFLNSINQMIL